jgi:hypothetical protein
VRREEHDATVGIQVAAAASEAPLGEPVHEGFVRREEQLERCAGFDLPREVARRPVGDARCDAGVALEAPDDLVERELQIGGCGDEGRRGRRTRPS